MTATGLILMLSAVVGMTGLLGWCIYKVISTPDSTKHLHSPLDIDAGDKSDPTNPKTRTG